MSTETADFDEKRNPRRVADALNNLLKDAPNGRLKCAAIRLGAFEALTISSHRLYRWYLTRITATS
jgi:hypothetical protein